MGRKRSKKDTSKTDKNAISMSVKEGSSSSNEQEMPISQKLDILIDVVANMGNQIKEQDARLQKQEERSSIGDLSAVPVIQSSPKPQKMPSVQMLKDDARVQEEVDRRLQEYQDMSRTEFTGRLTSRKSGRYRVGVTKVKVQTNWPHDFCTVPVGTKQPVYDDMSNEQWVQGMIACILEESDNKIRNQMLIHFSRLMQDAVELSLGTVRRAHAAVLQEIERGLVSWEDTENIEKCRSRYTQRLLQSVKSSPSQNSQSSQTCIFFNKGKCKHENDHVSAGVMYQHACSYCLKETKKRYDHPASQCMRMRNAGPKTINVSPKGEKQKV